MDGITPTRDGNQSPVSVTDLHAQEEKRLDSSFFPCEVDSSVKPGEEKREFTSELTDISDQFLDELEKDMFAESEDIERQLAELRGLRTKNPNQFKENLLEGGSLRFSSLNFSYAPAQAGVDFLTRLFPDSLIEELALDTFELNQLARLAVTLLHSISTQSKTTELLCKEKLLEKSTELRDKLIREANNDLTSTPSTYRLEEIDLWGVNISDEKRKIKLEKHNFSNMKSKHYLTTRCISSLTNIFNSFVVGPLNYIFSLTWITKLFNIVVAGLSLKKIRSENQSLAAWRKNYNNWRSKHQPTLVTKEGGEMRLKPGLALAEKTIKKPYEKLEKLIQNESVAFIIDQLIDSGLKLPSTIKTKDDLIHFLEKNPSIKEHYNAFSDRMNSLNAIITTSENLLEKRRAIRESRLYHLASRFDEIKETIKSIKLEEFNRIENKPTDLVFEVWFNNQSPKRLLNDYIDHHETLEHAVKNGLKEMIQKKYELEGLFQKFRSAESHAVFFMTTALLTTSATLFAIGMLLTPVGGIGLIFLGFSAVSALMTTGFMAAGYLYAKKYRPATSELMTISFRTHLGLVNFRKSIANYFHQAKRKKLAETAKALYNLRPNAISNSSLIPKSSEEIEALDKYQKAKKAFNESLGRVNYWEASLNEYEAEIAKAGAKDVVRFALPNGRTLDHSIPDPLKELQQAVKKLDFNLLSPETQALFEEQLGISLEVLQNQIKGKSDTFKVTWERFFAIKEDALFDFIINQRERIKKEGYLNPSLTEEK